MGGHNWLDKSVVNKMINNFNKKDMMLKRSMLAKTAEPMKVRESKDGKRMRSKVDSEDARIRDRNHSGTGPMSIYNE